MCTPDVAIREDGTGFMVQKGGIWWAVDDDGKSGMWIAYENDKWNTAEGAAWSWGKTPVEAVDNALAKGYASRD
jgi:hypothetical protein